MIIKIVTMSFLLAANSISYCSFAGASAATSSSSCSSSSAASSLTATVKSKKDKESYNQKSTQETTQSNFVCDQYTERRGEPRMLEIRCKHCNSHVITYQKDGPGNLLRCYVDRVHNPDISRRLAYSRKEFQESRRLRCPKESCSKILGKPYIYTFKDAKTKKITETRYAYQLIKNSFYFSKD